MSKLVLGILASGRGSNLQAIIDAIQQGHLQAVVAVVVSDRADAFALERARRHNIAAVHLSPGDFPDRLAYDRAVAEVLEGYGVQVVALAGYMRLVSTVLLDHFPYRVVNIHPALLPAFPGLHAQKQAWEYGVKYSGCTVHFVDAGMDTGPIIAQAVVPVLDGDSAQDLADRILVEEHRLYPQVLQWMAEGRVQIKESRRVTVIPPVEQGGVKFCGIPW